MRGDTVLLSQQAAEPEGQVYTYMHLPRAEQPECAIAPGLLALPAGVVWGHLPVCV